MMMFGRFGATAALAAKPGNAVSHTTAPSQKRPTALKPEKNGNPRRPAAREKFMDNNYRPRLPTASQAYQFESHPCRAPEEKNRPPVNWASGFRKMVVDSAPAIQLHNPATQRIMNPSAPQPALPQLAIIASPVTFFEPKPSLPPSKQQPFTNRTILPLDVN
jgi:hypothetical protein